MKGFKGILIAVLVIGAGFYFGVNRSDSSFLDTRGSIHSLVDGDSALDSISLEMGYRFASDQDEKEAQDKKTKPKKPVRTMVAANKKRNLKGVRGKKEKLKKKKLTKKKKKKKKKDEKKKKEEETEVAEIEIEESEEEIVSRPETTTASGGFPPAGGNRGDGELTTVEEWLDFIGSNPTPKKTSQVLAALRSGKLTTGQVILIALDLLDRGGDRSTIEAIKLLGETPSDTAYAELAFINRDSNSARVKNVANQFRRRYLSGERIQILGSVITQTEMDPYVRQLAVSDAQLAARQTGGPESEIFALNEDNQYTHPSAIELSRLERVVATHLEREPDGDLRRIMNDLLDNLGRVLPLRSVAALDDDVTSFDQ